MTGIVICWHFKRNKLVTHINDKKHNFVIFFFFAMLDYCQKVYFSCQTRLGLSLKPVLAVTS